jgi:hypothetical protein
LLETRSKKSNFVACLHALPISRKILDKEYVFLGVPKLFIDATLTLQQIYE